MVCKASEGIEVYKDDVCKFVVCNKVESIVVYKDDVCKFVVCNKVVGIVVYKDDVSKFVVCNKVEGKVVSKNEVCKFVLFNKVKVFKYIFDWLDKKTWDEFPEYKEVDIKVEYALEIKVFEFVYGKEEYIIVVSLNLIGKSDKSENESVILSLNILFSLFFFLK